MVRFAVRVAAQSFLWFGAVGLADGLAQIGRFPYWFHSPLDRFFYVAALVALYGLLGLVLGSLTGVCGRLLCGGGEGSPGTDVSLALGATLFCFGGFLIHRDLIGDFSSVAGIVVSLLLVQVGLVSIWWLARPANPVARISTRLARPLRGFLVAGLCIAAALGGFPHGSSAGRPNVLLIVVDTLRADRLSCYGNPRATTPSIDRISREGVLFVDAITPAPLTQPAVASILTGVYPGVNGVVNHPNRLAERWTTLAELFRHAGYRTGFVNTHPLLTHAWGFGRGWDEYRLVDDPVRFDATLLGQILRRFGLRNPRMSERAGAVADAGIEFLRRNRSRSFFLYLHFLDPHFPYRPSPPFDRMFSRSGTPALLDARLPDGRRDIFGVEAPPEEITENVALYDGEIAYTDREIGRLIGALDALGLAERTVVIITGDHGESLGEQGLFFAHTHYLYDSTQRVPLVLRLPGVFGDGRTIDRQVGLTDLAPTLLGIAGISAPPQMEGRRLDRMIRGEAEEQALVYAENGRTILRNGEEDNPRWYVGGDGGMWGMVRSGGWKLIRIPTPGGAEFELFDLEEDPGETRNLAAIRPDLLDRLREPLDRWRGEPGAPGAADTAVDERTLEGLRSLGYVQ